jgi:hypothetical protein
VARRGRLVRWRMSSSNLLLLTEKSFFWRRVAEKLRQVISRCFAGLPNKRMQQTARLFKRKALEL